MLDFVRNLTDVSDFPARWTCGQWTAGHGYLHILSDLGTWGAYTAIPIVIGYFVIQRRDLPFPKLFWIFGAFIFFCGSVHLMEAVIFYWPAYRVSGVLKLGTAIVSWAAVFALVRVVPVALRYPGLERVNKELTRANRELDEFAHVVSHDLKAPLRAIRSLAEWISEDSDELNPKSRKDLDLLIERTSRMEALIRGILEYSSIGRVDVPVGRVDTNTVVHEVVADLEPPEHVEIAVPETLPVIRYNETMFRQVVQNLLTNAINYGDKPKVEIRIMAEEGADGWAFTVADNGQGIDPAHHDRIFRVFQSLAPGEAQDGTGIGLSIVKKIVENAGGTIHVESTLGQGSVFRFTIPKSVQQLGKARED